MAIVDHSLHQIPTAWVVSSTLATLFDETPAAVEWIPSYSLFVIHLVTSPLSQEVEGISEFYFIDWIEYHSTE